MKSDYQELLSRVSTAHPEHLAALRALAEERGRCRAFIRDQDDPERRLQCSLPAGHDPLDGHISFNDDVSACWCSEHLRVLAPWEVRMLLQLQEDE